MSKSARPNRLTVNGYTFSPGELEWARQNLDKMRRTARGNTPLLVVMLLTFVLGLIIYFVSDGIQAGAIALPADWRASLIADFLYNLGVVLWTSVVLVFFLEVVVEYQRKRWQRYVQLIEHVLKEQGQAVTTAGEEIDDDIATRLDAIMNKLSGLEVLQSDVAALKAKLESQ